MGNRDISFLFPQLDIYIYHIIPRFIISSPVTSPFTGCFRPALPIICRSALLIDSTITIIVLNKGFLTTGTGEDLIIYIKSPYIPSPKLNYTQILYSKAVDLSTLS